MADSFGCNAHFAQQVKQFSERVLMTKAARKAMAFDRKCIGVKTFIRTGNPDRALISTSHVERTNLSVRLFNRRYTRLTMGFSKTFRNHRYSVSLFIAHFNFCRVHSAHKQTPAMAAGLTDHVWTIQELLENSTIEQKQL